MGIKIKKRRIKKRKIKKKKKETKNDNIFTNDNRQENDTAKVLPETVKVMKDDIASNDLKDTQSMKAVTEATEKEKPDKKKSKIKNVIDKITHIYDTIKSRIKKFIKLLKDTYNKVNGAKEKLTNKIEEIKSMVNDAENRELVSLIISQIKRLFKEIKPKKYDINVHFGFEEPDVTGKVLMYIAVFYGITGLNINIKPEFEEKIFEGDCYLKGRIRVITLLSIALKVYKNKRFKQIINK